MVLILLKFVNMVLALFIKSAVKPRASARGYKAAF